MIMLYQKMLLLSQGDIKLDEKQPHLKITCLRFDHVKGILGLTFISPFTEKWVTFSLNQNIKLIQF